MHRRADALAVIAFLLVLQLGSKIGESLSLDWATCSRCSLRPLQNHAATSLSSNVASEAPTLTATEAEQHRRPSRRRVSRTIRSRARRLARARRNQIRQQQKRQQQPHKQQPEPANSINIVLAEEDANDLSERVNQQIVVDMNGNTQVHPTNNVDKRERVSTIKDRGLLGAWFSPRPLRSVDSVAELSSLIDDHGWDLEHLSVITGTGTGTGTGPNSDIGSVEGKIDEGTSVMGGEVAAVHPVVQAVLKRAAAGTLPSSHTDDRRIGLAIEGGGMRGCVAAGMASCLHYLGLADSFDAVYGASAGSLVGAYFVSRQPNGTAVYHDVLPAAGARFIDMKQFPQAMGFELPRVGKGTKKPKANVSKEGSKGGGHPEPSGNPASAKFARVIGLDFLLRDVVGEIHQLDFESFAANDRLQPLHVVTSGVKSMSSVSLTSRGGHFSTIDQFTECIRASMLVPGLAGPLLTMPTPTPQSVDKAAEVEKMIQYQRGRRKGAWEVGLSRRYSPSWALGDWWSRRKSKARGSAGLSSDSVVGESTELANATTAAEVELLVDAMVFEPLPYRSAVEDGCTDVVVLCTRPEGSEVLGKKPSLYETRVVKKFFEQHEDPAAGSEISNHLRQLKHLRTYAEDALLLRKGSRTSLSQLMPQGGPGQGREAFLMAIAPEASCKEVGQLEMDRKNVLQGCRDGFAACYDVFASPAAVAARTRAAAGGDAKEEIGVSTRHCSGTEAAREYFPDSLLSLPRDLNAAYLERGDPIWPRENVPRPPLPEQSSTPGATAAAAAAPNSRRHTRRAAFTAAAGSAVRRKRRRPASVATAEEGRPRGRLRRLLSPW